MDILKLKFQNIDPYLIKSKVLKNNGQEDKNFYEYKIPNFTNDQSHNYLISIPFKHIDHPKYGNSQFIFSCNIINITSYILA